MLLKNVFIGFLSFSILHADTLKECKTEADRISGCVEREYHDNGKFWVDTPYKNGKREGVVKEYDEKGNLRFETPYTNGKRQGIAKAYYKNGGIQVEADVLNDIFHGDIRFYAEDGELLALLKTEDHEIISGKCFNDKALTIKEIRQIDIFDTEKAVIYLQEICLKESDSK